MRERRVRITKCYLVEVIDFEGNALDCSYVFGDKEDAKAEGRLLLESAARNQKKEEDEQ